MSEAITNGVRIQVTARFLEERSNPHANKFVFAYTVTITNMEQATVQLLSRKWIIKDADGDVETVEGPGVVGEKPVLQPGQSFTDARRMLAPPDTVASYVMPARSASGPPIA